MMGLFGQAGQGQIPASEDARPHNDFTVTHNIHLAPGAKAMCCLGRAMAA